MQLCFLAYNILLNLNFKLKLIKSRTLQMRGSHELVFGCSNCHVINVICCDGISGRRFWKTQFFAKSCSEFGPRFCNFFVRVSNARHWTIGLPGILKTTLFNESKTDSSHVNHLIFSNLWRFYGRRDYMPSFPSLILLNSIYSRARGRSERREWIGKWVPRPMPQLPTLVWVRINEDFYLRP